MIMKNFIKNHQKLFDYLFQITIWGTISLMIGVLIGQRTNILGRLENDLKYSREATELQKRAEGCSWEQQGNHLPAWNCPEEAGSNESLIVDN